MVRTISIKKHLAPVMVLTVVCLAVYFNTLGNAFLWDDYALIRDNEYIRDIKNIPFFFSPEYWNEFHPFPGQYRPIRRASLTLDYWLWGLNPAGYHLTNILLHAINTVLIFGLVSLIPGRTAESAAQGNRTGWNEFVGIPFITALLFAAHPIHTESINLVKNRSDLLAFLFFLLSFLLFVRHLRSDKRTISLALLIGAWLGFVPAVLSKEVALTLPVVLAFYGICFSPAAEQKKILIRIVPYGLLIFFYFWFRHWWIRPIPSPHQNAGFEFSGMDEHVLTVIKTLGIYFKMLVKPFPLNPDHVFTMPSSVFEASVLLSLLALTIFCVICVWAYRRERLVIFALGWILLTLLPVANIYYLFSRPIAAQRLYIPSLGFCLLLGFGCKQLRQIMAQRFDKKGVAMSSRFLIFFIVIVYAGLTIQRNRECRNSVTFFSKAVALSPDNENMNYNLAVSYLKEQRIEEAVGQFQTLVGLKPHDFMAHFNLGGIFKDLKRYEEAIAHYQEALRSRPDDSGVYYNLGLALEASGRFEEAVNHYLAATRFKPDFFEACYNLGLVFYKTGRYQEAAFYYLSALQIRPDDVETLNNLGAVYYSLERLEEACHYYREVLNHAPDNINANINIGNALLDLGCFDQAVAYYSIGLRAAVTRNDTAIYQELYGAIIQTGRLVKGIQRLSGAVQIQLDGAEMLNQFGMALVETGQVEEGIGYFRSVLQIMPDNADAYCNLGATAVIQGRYEQAGEYFRRSLEINPDHPRAKAAYQELLRRMGSAPAPGPPDDGDGKQV